MHVRQLSIAYVPEQDRILIRINTSDERELQFWFTRRLTLGLAPLMERTVTEIAASGQGSGAPLLADADPVAQSVLAEFKRDETIRRADFSTPYRPADTSEPVFASALLITEITLAPAGGGKLRLQCTEKLGGTANARTFALALSETLTHAFMHLLERAVVASQWQADPCNEAGNALAPAPSRRTGYLN